MNLKEIKVDKNYIANAKIDGLTVKKVFTNSTSEVILITLEKDAVFPEHTSPKDTLLVVLEGAINFYIENNTVLLNTNQVHSFKKEIPHHVIAKENSKFLIIR